MIISANNGSTSRFHICNSVGAIVRTGLSRFQCGDSLLIDVRNSFFAVSDSPERNPSASVDFLHKIFATFGRFRSQVTHIDQPFVPNTEALKLLIEKVNEIIADVDYNNNTTFTGILILQKWNRNNALLLHSGDSLMFHVHTNERKTEKLTKTNHWFVGRSKRIFQTLLFEYDMGSRFLLASDGFSDICNNCPQPVRGNLPAKLIEIFHKHSIDKIPELLLDKYDRSPETSDDLGIIALDPNQLNSFS